MSKKSSACQLLSKVPTDSDFHLRPGYNVGSWNNSDLHCTSRSQHVCVDPGSQRGPVPCFPRWWWGGSLIWGQPSMDCLGSPSTDLLFPSLITQRGSAFVGKQVKEWEGTTQGLFALLRRQAILALMVCLSLRTSWSFDAELSLISGLLSYFVLFELLVGDEVGKRNLQ